MHSSGPSPLLVDQLFDFGELFRRRFRRRERLKNELRRGAAERAVHQIGDELPFGVVLRVGGRVYVRPRRLVAPNEAFLGHDLQELQDGGVAGFAAHDLGHLADSAWTARPQDTQDGQLGISRLPTGSVHGPVLSTTVFVVSIRMVSYTTRAQRAQRTTKAFGAWLLA